MWSSISIDHDRRNNIHRYVPALEHKQSLGIIPRIFELADEREEGHVTSVRENDVGDAQESVRKDITVVACTTGSGRSMPMAIIVIRTALKMEMNAVAILSQL